MGQPRPFNRITSYTDYSAANPSRQQPGAQLDAEFDAVKATTDDIRTNIAKIQRDDGELANESVGMDQLAPDAVAYLGSTGSADVIAAINEAGSVATAAQASALAAQSASEAVRVSLASKTILQLSAETVPADVSVLSVAGIATVGDYGAGLPMVFDAGVDEAYVAENPSTSFIDMAGRGFRQARRKAIDIDVGDDGNLQNAIAVAADPSALIALMTPSLPTGSTIRTANGFLYEVAAAIVTDEHLSTAGGMKLYVVPINGCLHASAFGVVTGDWVVDDFATVVDSAPAMQKAFNALKSRMALILPAGTIYIGSTLTVPYGQLSVTIKGEGPYGPATIIQYLNGVTNGINLPHEAYNFENIGFRGAPTGTGRVLFNSTRTDNYVDQDWYFKNCWFQQTDHVGVMNGRGLIVDSCLFGQCSGDLFVLNYPSSPIFLPSGYIGSLAGGFRNFIIINSRFHQTQGHMFNVTGNNASNCRGFVINNNWGEAYPRFIRGHLNDATVSGNNFWGCWNSSDATMFDLINCKGLAFVGNTISNSTNDRQQGDNPLIRVTGTLLQGLVVVGNMFVRRDVMLLDMNIATGTSYVQDVRIKGNAYQDCFAGSAANLVRILGCTGLVYNVDIDEAIYQTPGTWLAVNADSNWRNSSAKVKMNQAGAMVHNIPNVYSRDNELKIGSYNSSSTGAPIPIVIGWPVKSVKIFKVVSQTLVCVKIQSPLTSGPSTITFTDTGFTVGTDPSVNPSSPTATFTYEAH